MNIRFFINNYKVPIFICIQYFYNYLRKETGYDDWNNEGCFHENNPILNLVKINNKKRALIVEPVNFLTTFTILFSNNLYKKSKIQGLSNFHQNALYMLFLGTLFQHGSCTRYGIDLDLIGMIAYFTSLILKDLVIIGIIDKKNKVFYATDIFFQTILILISIPKYRELHEKKRKYRIKWKIIFYVVVGLKITSEIKKYTNGKYFIFCNLLFLVLYILEKKDPIKNLKKRITNLFKHNCNTNVLNTLFKLPWIFSIIFSFLIKNKKPRYLDGKKIFLRGIILIGIAFLFQEENTLVFKKKDLPKKNAILQFHALWHILVFMGLYSLDKYALENIKKIN